jgi:hypothetical protein
MRLLIRPLQPCVGFVVLLKVAVLLHCSDNPLSWQYLHKGIATSGFITQCDPSSLLACFIAFATL